MDKFMDSIVTVLTAIIGVAIVATIVKSQNTSQIITAGGNAFTGALTAAKQP